VLPSAKPMTEREIWHGNARISDSVMPSLVLFVGLRPYNPIQ